MHICTVREQFVFCVVATTLAELCVCVSVCVCVCVCRLGVSSEQLCTVCVTRGACVCANRTSWCRVKKFVLLTATVGGSKTPSYNKAHRFFVPTNLGLKFYIYMLSFLYHYIVYIVLQYV